MKMPLEAAGDLAGIFDWEEPGKARRSSMSKADRPEAAWEEGGKSRRSRSRRHRKRKRAASRRGSALPDDADESLLSEEELAYRAAERRAQLFIDAGKFGLVVLVLLVVSRPIGFIAFLVWAIKYGRRAFGLLVEPGLRKRLVEDEVSRQVQVNVRRERHELSDAHARTLETLSASLAHEIRNPITAAKSLVQQMGERPDAPENTQYAQVALAELERVERSISHLLRFGRDEDLSVASLRMVDVLDSALETFRERAAREGVEISRDFDCEGSLLGDAEKLRRVVINLVGNSMDALADARRDASHIEVAMGENLAGSEVWLRIRDDGPGMDDQTRARIFTPFFTSKESGTGLGLAITKKLIEAHLGRIEVHEAPGGGAEFVVTLPKDAGLRGNA
jgi:signal transduction histidine kinase